MLTKEDSMINVKKRGSILQGREPKTETSSQIFHLKTSLICSLEEVTRQVSVAVLCFHAKLVRCIFAIHCCTLYDLSVNLCCIILGNANVYTNGRMRYPRRERRERQRDVSYY